jgi:hypothetical protein
MVRRFLVDTDVLIEYLRGSAQAIRFLEGVEGSLCVSAITVAELYSGAKGEEEETALAQFLSAFEVIPVDEPLAVRGGLCRRDFGPRHGVGLADALVAVSAEDADAVLVTFNKRHYPMLREVIVPYHRK